MNDVAIYFLFDHSLFFILDFGHSLVFVVKSLQYMDEELHLCSNGYASLCFVLAWYNYQIILRYWKRQLL